MNRTPIESIQISEDRFRFTEEMTDIDEKVVPSRSSNPFSRIPTRITSESDKTWRGFDRVVCSSGRIRLKGFRQLTAEIRPRLFGSDGIRLGIIDLGRCF
jgi:hypothetical protein